MNPKPLKVWKRWGVWTWTCLSPTINFDCRARSADGNYGYTEHWLAADAARAHWRIVHEGAGGS